MPSWRRWAYLGRSEIRGGETSRVGEAGRGPLRLVQCERVVGRLSAPTAHTGGREALVSPKGEGSAPRQVSSERGGSFGESGALRTGKLVWWASPPHPQVTAFPTGSTAPGVLGARPLPMGLRPRSHGESAQPGWPPDIPASPQAVPERCRDKDGLGGQTFVESQLPVPVPDPVTAPSHFLGLSFSIRKRKWSYRPEDI